MGKTESLSGQHQTYFVVFHLRPLFYLWAVVLTLVLSVILLRRKR